MSTNVHLQRLGKYELQELLGSGPWATVWKAFDPQLQRHIVIKLPHSELQDNADFMQRFWSLPLEREAQKLVALRHPAIVRIHGFYVSLPQASHNPVAYLVMDHVEGQNLADYIGSISSTGNYPTAAEVIQLLAPLASAIDSAHKHGVVHGDIKPNNILLNRRDTACHLQGQPLLADFGLNSLLEIPSGPLDNRSYASPEQLRGQPASERSDIYAFGLIFYELCTGVHPFHEDGSEQQDKALPLAPHLVRAQIPPSLSAVIMRSLAREPEERFASAASLIEAAAAALDIPVPEGLSLHFDPEAAVNGSNRQRGRSGTLTMPDFLMLAVAPSPPDFTVRLTPETPVSESEAEASAPQQAAQAGEEEPLPQSQGHRIPATDPPLPIIIAPWQTGQGAMSPVTTSQPPPSTPSPTKPAFDGGRKRRGLRKTYLVALIMLLLLALVSAITVPLALTLRHSQAGVGAISSYGSVAFVSSGELYVNNNQGINDEVRIDLHDIPAPATGKSYYAWLLGEAGQPAPSWTFLGTLSVSGGKVHFLYPGNAAHTNLLATMSRFLITEGDANITPGDPLLDRKSWRYYGEIAHQLGGSGAHQLSMLDYLRYVLVQAPELQALNLSGGVSIWLDRNTEEISKWALSAKESWETKNFARMRQLLTNILYYLDGPCATDALQGMPQGMPLLPENLTILHIATFSLITPCTKGMGNQSNDLKQLFQHTPNDLSDHLLFDLAGAAGSPGATSDIQVLIGQITTTVHSVRSWLQRVREDVLQLGHMSDSQLTQLPALSLLSGLEVQARYAYAGRTDPSTGAFQGGATWIYDNTARVATIVVTAYPVTD